MLDFLGIGAQKAGTTWLYERLRLHPDISFPAGKEVHFWDLQYERGIEWYCSLFTHDKCKCLGEITPAYAMLPKVRIEEMRDINPSLKIIYILRNPIHRAWSSALMALKRAEMTIDEASNQWFIDHFHSAGSLARGDYLGALKSWLSCFPEKQLLLLRYDLLKEKPRAILTQSSHHIGVDPGFFESISDATLSQRVFSGGGEKIRSSLYPVLVQLYERQIDSLSHFLGWDLKDWH